MTHSNRPSVAIVGAGPSGTAAAICLARAGHPVTLVDRHRFPRDKTCGDALIPDALCALTELGLIDRVRQEALQIPFVRIYAPNRSSVDVGGDLACWPREKLDNMLLEGAIAAGAEFIPDTEFRGVIGKAGRIVGVVARTCGVDREISSTYTILATGAASDALAKAGVCLRKEPSGVALRAYFEVPPGLADDIRYCAISFERKMCPGYGWIFPGPGNIFNVGVGVFYDGNGATANLRELWNTFLDDFESARRIRQNARQLTAAKGAPLRTALQGAQFCVPGLLIVGEAAGTTYSFSGEGIGKAMQSGMLAAKCIIGGKQHGKSSEAVYQESLLQQFASRYRAYNKAQHWLSSPLICNFIAAQANRGNYVKRQLEAFLAETANPAELFSLAGMAKALVMP